MTEKTLKTRVVLKHDTEANWSNTAEAGKGANFIPKSGEVIVYECSDGSRKFKIGDGTSAASALPFQGIYEIDGNYNESTNKVATVATITNKINELESSAAPSSSNPDLHPVLTSITQTDGKISQYESINLQNVAVDGKIMSLSQDAYTEVVVLDCGNAYGTVPALDAPVTTLNDGVLSWEKVDRATDYELYEQKSTDEYEYKTSTKNLSINLASVGLTSGAYMLNVQATSPKCPPSKLSNSVTYVTGYNVTFSNEIIPTSGFSTSAFTLYIDGVRYPGSALVSSLQGKTFNNVKKIKFVSTNQNSEYQYMIYTTASGATINYPEDGFGNWQQTYELTLTEDLVDVCFSEHGCLSLDTDVTMADNSTKKLGDIKVGDVVKSWDFETNSPINKTITSTNLDENVKFRTVNPYFKLTFSDGTIIKHAGTHRFYNVEKQAFVYTIYWNIGEHTYKEDGTQVALVSRELINEKLVHGKITMDDYTCYFANGLMTGDRRCPTDISVG